MASQFLTHTQKIGTFTTNQYRIQKGAELMAGTPIYIENDDRSNEIRKQIVDLIPKSHKTYTSTQLVVDRAEGVRLWNPEGREFIDFSSGVLVANLGHNHPYFEEQYASYIGNLPRNAYNMLTEIEVTAAKRLIKNLNHKKMERVLWSACGSSGIIKAIWSALHYHPDRHIILSTKYGFHGKKGLAGDITGEKSTNPNVRWIDFIMFADQRDVREHPSDQDLRIGQQLDALKREYPNQISMLVTEPYLGAKGSFHPPSWYLRQLNDWCNENNVVFILDEVQSCHGRTGEMYAFQKHGLDPDLIVMGKGIGNGEPICAVVGRADILDLMDYGEASDTFSGNPRGCAAVVAALDTFEKFPIVENCRKMSEIVADQLYKLIEEFEFLGQARGEGLVWGLEINAYAGKSANEIANESVLQAYHHGIHLIGPLAGNVLRISPPLIISHAEVIEGFNRLYKAFDVISSMKNNGNLKPY